MHRWGHDSSESHHAARTAFDMTLDDLREEEDHPTAGHSTWLRVTFSDGSTSGVGIPNTPMLLLDVASSLQDVDGSTVEHVALTTHGLVMERMANVDDVLSLASHEAANDMTELDNELQRAIITIIVTRLSAAVLVLPYAHLGSPTVLAMPAELPRLDVDGIARSSYRPVVLALVEAFDDDVRTAARARLDA